MTTHANGTDPALPLEELSWSITKNASILSHYLAAHNLPQPSADSDGPSTILPAGSPQSVQQARESLIAASIEILQLAIGPSEFLPHLATGFQYTSILNFLCEFNIFTLTPVTEPISYTDLATVANVPPARLRSILRMAMTTYLFRETADGQSITHSATSALIARNEDVRAYARYMSSRTALMAVHMAPAYRKWGADSERTDETAFNAAFGTDLPFFKYLERNKDFQGDFARYMQSVRTAEGVDITHLLSGFDWGRLGEGAVVVDVGGSTGTSAIALAKAYPRPKFTVQDLPANVESGRKAAESLPDDLQARITFQAHDFTTPQPVQGADVYLLRMILHDWPDAETVAILKHLVAAMSPGESRLLIMDTVLPKPGSRPVSTERIFRARDLTMMQAFNSKERELDDWIGLLSAADSGLRLVNVVEPFGSAMSVLEVVLE